MQPLLLNLILLVLVVSKGTDSTSGLYIGLWIFFSSLLCLYFLIRYKNITLNENTLTIESRYLGKLLKPSLFNLRNIKEVIFYSESKYHSPRIKIRSINDKEIEKSKVLTVSSINKGDLKLLFDTLKKNDVNVIVDSHTWEYKNWKV